MLFGCTWNDTLGTLHALLNDTQVNACPIRKVFAGAAKYLFKQGLSLGILLLLKILYAFLKRLHLLFDGRIDQCPGRIFHL